MQSYILFLKCYFILYSYIFILKNDQRSPNVSWQLVDCLHLGQTQNNKIMLKNNQNVKKYYLLIYIFVIQFKNLDKGIYIYCQCI